jgi:Protein of unknown function (DUF3489)
VADHLLLVASIPVHFPPRRLSIAWVASFSISLAFLAFRVIHVVTRGNHRRGENMITPIAEENASDQTPVTGKKPKATKKVHVRPKRTHVAPKKGTSAKRATPAKKAPKGTKKADSARAGSKTAKVLDLLKRPGGVTATELTKATGWQAHSVRGFLSGTLRKKMGLTVESTKRDDSEHVYKIVK